MPENIQDIETKEDAKKDPKKWLKWDSDGRFVPKLAKHPLYNEIRKRLLELNESPVIVKKWLDEYAEGKNDPKLNIAVVTLYKLKQKLKDKEPEEKNYKVRIVRNSPVRDDKQTAVMWRLVDAGTEMIRRALDAKGSIRISSVAELSSTIKMVRDCLSEINKMSDEGKDGKGKDIALILTELMNRVSEGESVEKATEGVIDGIGQPKDTVNQETVQETQQTN